MLSAFQVLDLSLLQCEPPFGGKDLETFISRTVAANAEVGGIAPVSSTTNDSVGDTDWNRGLAAVNILSSSRIVPKVQVRVAFITIATELDGSMVDILRS